jgi:AraC family transcriptional regulator, alkane utilization regulator
MPPRTVPGRKTASIPVCAPAHLTDSPDFMMDALSDLLRLMRLDGALFLEGRFSAPWCIESGREQARDLFDENRHVVFFHVVTRGRCRVRLKSGGEALELKAGDLVLMAHDDTHLLGSDLQLAPADTAALVRPAPAGGLLSMEHGGGGEPTWIMCGYLSCDPFLSRPLLDALPRMLRVSLGDGAPAQWLLGLLERGARENLAPGPGSRTMLAKLAELLFVEAMRRHVAASAIGWLAGLRDHHVGRALALLHEDPMRDWKVEGLAAGAGLSRSVLTRRFTELVGQPPMQYLKRWRLGLAATELRDSRRTIAALAGLYGYESEAAFNRAFKQTYGVPPAAWRRRGAA